MINSSFRLFALLIATFALLTTMWVNAAQADTGCRKVGQSVTMCDGAGWQLPEAPRGAARPRPAYSVDHRLHAALSAAKRLQAERRGTTVVIARLGVRNY